MHGSGPIPSTFVNQSGLINLALQSNNLSGEIPQSICNLGSLRILYLSNNNLEGPLPDCLGNLSSSLSILHLNANKFTGLIPSTFSKGCNLQFLTLKGNKVEGTLPQSLFNCQILQVVDIGNNEIRGSFPFWMETLPELRVLVLRSNKFNGTTTLSSTIEHPFPKLQVLDVSYNDFSGLLPDRYFKNFRGMVDAKENKTNDRVFIELTLTLKGLDFSLQRLLTTFTTIDLSSNRFFGNIPPSLGNLNSLRYLNLSHNDLIGNIPSSIGNMSVLESLDLSSNKLDGGIPSELTRLTFLAKLNLSMNSLVGQIPQSTQFSTFENESYVGNVGLCGAPLTKRCERIDEKPQEGDEGDDESSFVNGFGWEAIVLGYGCGFVIGVFWGYLILRYERPKWFVELFLDSNNRGSE